jgi:hypothetical protein
MILLMPLLVSLCLPQTAVLSPAAVSTAAVQLATPEFDMELIDWQKGMPLALKHSLFQLDYVSAGQFGQILFKGQSYGDEGEITLDFYTLDGDLVHVPRNHLLIPQVDKERTSFTVGAIVPDFLRGRTGVVQVTYSGAKRAAFLLKVNF